MASNLEDATDAADSTKILNTLAAIGSIFGESQKDPVPVVVEVDGCASQPCQNGAECSDVADSALGNGDAGYTCVCNNGYSGVSCEKNDDDCSQQLQ